MMFFAAEATRRCVYEDELYDDEVVKLQMREVRGGWRVVRLRSLLNVCLPLCFSACRTSWPIRKKPDYLLDYCAAARLC